VPNPSLCRACGHPLDVDEVLAGQHVLRPEVAGAPARWPRAVPPLWARALWCLALIALAAAYAFLWWLAFRAGAGL
jgi:hypothetical protein